MLLSTSLGDVALVVFHDAPVTVQVLAFAAISQLVGEMEREPVDGGRGVQVNDAVPIIVFSLGT